MPFNFLAVIVAAFVTLLMGFIWYHPKVFGTIWMNETGMTEEKAKQGNMAKVFGLTIFYSLLLSFMMPVLVIHQFGALGIMVDQILLQLQNLLMLHLWLIMVMLLDILNMVHCMV